MLLENIPLGKTLEIFVEREDYRYRLVSKVEDTNEFRVCVTAISSSGRFFEFLPEDHIRIVYRDQNFMWEWDKVRAGLAKLEGFPVHYFQIVDKGRTFNRRNAYRVKLLQDVVLGYYRIPGRSGRYFDIPKIPADLFASREEEEVWIRKASRSVYVKAMIKDVSENGIGLYSDEKFRVGDGFFFNIPSPYGNLPVKASVVRKNNMKSIESRFDYYYGCILAKSNRKLLHYIYDLQREYLRKQREMGDARRADKEQ